MKVSFLPRTIRDNAARRRWRRLMRSPFLDGDAALTALSPHHLRQLGILLTPQRRTRSRRIGPRWLDWRAQIARRAALRAVPIESD